MKTFISLPLFLLLLTFYSHPDQVIESDMEQILQPMSLEKRLRCLDVNINKLI